MDWPVILMGGAGMTVFAGLAFFGIETLMDRRSRND